MTSIYGASYGVFLRPENVQNLSFDSTEDNGIYQHRVIKLDEALDEICRKGVQREILDYLLRKMLPESRIDACISVRGLAHDIKRSPTRVQWALKDLETRGVIEYIYKAKARDPKVMEEKAIFGIKLRAAPSLIQLPWLTPYLPKEQKNFRAQKKIERFKANSSLPKYQADGRVSEAQKILGPSAIAAQLEKKENHIQSNTVSIGSVSTQTVSLCDTVLTDTVSIFDTSSINEDYIYNNLNIFTDFYHVSCPDIPIPDSRPIEAQIQNQAQVEARPRPKPEPKDPQYKNLRVLLARYWNENPEKAKIEFSFFQEMKKKYPKDLNTIFLTLRHFENTKKDFLGMECNPMERIRSKWEGMRKTAENYFSQKEKDLRSLPLEEYEFRYLKGSSPKVVEHGDESPSHEVIEFCKQFPEGAARIEAIKKYGSVYLGVKSSGAIAVAALTWSKTKQTIAQVEVEKEIADETQAQIPEEQEIPRDQASEVGEAYPFEAFPQNSYGLSRDAAQVRRVLNTNLNPKPREKVPISKGLSALGALPIFSQLNQLHTTGEIEFVQKSREKTIQAQDLPQWPIGFRQNLFGINASNGSRREDRTG